MKLGFIQAYGISYQGTLPKIRKNKNQLQPLFEAFTNSLEALKPLDKSDRRIVIRLHSTKNLFSNEEGGFNFQKFTIIDNGKGLTDEEFERLIFLNDNRKGFSNKGTGRVQFLHFFEDTYITSIYEAPDSSTGYRERKIKMSKNKAFLDNNAIINYLSNAETEQHETSTTVSFELPISEKDAGYYDELNLEILKEELINRYLAYFCENRNTMPQILLEHWVDDKSINSKEIKSKDIPKVNHEENFNVYYRERLPFRKSHVLTQTTEYELFNLKSFIISGEKLPRNEIKLTSKGEIAKSIIKLDNLSPTDKINDKRYLFLLSSDYIDNRDSDNRGDIKIMSREEFKNKKEDGFFNDKEIVIEDIEEFTNEIIVNYYGEIKNKTEDKLKNIEKLKDMFLLNEETLKSLNVGLNESDDEILKKVYQSDVKIIAKRDAEIKHQIEELEKMTPDKSPEYISELTQKVNAIVKTIPLQNRTALTHYVARRKLVLELFDKILKKQTDILRSGGRIDEKIMHNLIFQQSSDNPSESDLWIINEEFIYFTGVSEQRLSQVMIDEKRLFKDEFEKEEERYLNSLGERRLDTKPDVLLFPEEGKCIIIEFKAPDVNASFHLTQIDRYAYLIRNYTNDEFQITRFYGYLIGESIEVRDVRGTVSRYEYSPNFNYLFRPSENVTGEGRPDGSIYSEVIKYSTLLKRAQLRNKVFIDKLTEKLSDTNGVTNVTPTSPNSATHYSTYPQSTSRPSKLPD